MLGASLGKILILVALIAGAWIILRRPSRRVSAGVRKKFRDTAERDDLRTADGERVLDSACCDLCGKYYALGHPIGCDRQGCPL